MQVVSNNFKGNKDEHFQYHSVLLEHFNFSLHHLASFVLYGLKVNF
jgi:hypothetical protein